MTSIPAKFVKEKKFLLPPADTVVNRETAGEIKCKVRPSFKKEVIIKDGETKYKVVSRDKDLTEHDLKSPCMLNVGDLSCCKKGLWNCKGDIFDVVKKVLLRKNDEITEKKIIKPKKKTYNPPVCEQKITKSEIITKRWYEDGPQSYIYERKTKDGYVKEENKPQRIRLKNERVLILNDDKDINRK